MPSLSLCVCVCLRMCVGWLQAFEKSASIILQKVVNKELTTVDDVSVSLCAPRDFPCCPSEGESACFAVTGRRGVCAE